MLRKICPWCNREVDTEGKDLIKTVNGSIRNGINFRTTMYAHRSCYERMVKENEKRSHSVVYD